MTKPYNVRLEDEDGPEVERLMKEDRRDASYIIRLLVREALITRKSQKESKERISAGDSRP